MKERLTHEEIDKHNEYIARLKKEHREREEREAIERGEYLWYVVLRHSNRRVLTNGVPEIFDDYDAARERAAGISITMTYWYVPIRVSEYNETFGRFNTTGSLTINVDGRVTE